MHESALARAALPAPTVCLGILLRKYSLGHELWLLREESPFVTGRNNKLEFSLPDAVLICCQTWEQLSGMSSDPLLSFKLWIWQKRIATRCSNRSYVQSEMAKFIAYRKDGSIEFPLSQITRPDRGQPRLPGTPLLLRLQQWLMTHFQITEAEAWDYPAGLATMRWAAYWEAKGGLDVFNAQDQEEENFIRFCEERGGPSAAKLYKRKT